MTNVPDILQRIITVKEEELAHLRSRRTVEELRSAAAAMDPPRGFLRALQVDEITHGRPALVAEVKKASPSKGVIREDFDPCRIATQYRDGGAACLSVLTDERFFQGKLEFLTQIRNTVSLPLLRKDFVIDPLQLLESRAAGADAVLLIAACLETAQLLDLHAHAVELGMDVLVEFHDEAEWERIAGAGLHPPLCGINNRNLRDFTVSLDVTARLAPRIVAAGGFLVAESGIMLPADVRILAGHGAKAILVGESLMRQDDPAAAARVLLGG